jgi:short-subunit dehydrogenase
LLSQAHHEDGASRGLGKTLSATFSPQWQVIATARNPERIEKGANIIPMPLDIADEDSVQKFTHELVAQQIKVDLLINNAGFNPKDSQDPAYFPSTFTIKNFLAKNVAESMWINALMPMQLISQMLPVLTDNAVVLNISSWLGSIGGKTMPGHYGYAGSKALLNSNFQLNRLKSTKAKK